MIVYKDAFVNNDGVVFPDTAGINASGPAATDGTEFVKIMVDDEWGARQALMDVAGLTPSGVTESAAVDLTKPSGRKSQMLDAMFKLFERRAICIDAGVGTADAIEVDAIAALFEFYQDGLIIQFNPFEANTGAVTIDVDGLGAKDVVEPGGGALGGGEFQHDHFATLVFDLGNDRFEYINIPDGLNYDLSETGAVSSGVTVIPLDDTIPQQTEGTELLTVTITPKNKNSTLRIEANIKGSVSVGGTSLIGAIFRDAAASAIEASAKKEATQFNPSPIKLDIEVAAVDTVATTFKLRVGITANTWTVNGTAGARLLGGVMITSLRVTEILPKL